jgi:hypothetical protein
MIAAISHINGDFFHIKKFYNLVQDLLLLHQIISRFNTPKLN